MIELLFAAGQFDLGRQAIAIALLAGGIEFFNPADVVRHAGFGLSQAGLQLVEALAGHVPANG